MTIPLQGQFVVRRLGLLWSTCTPILKSPCSPTMKIWKVMQSVEIRVLWGLGVTQGHWQCHHSIECLHLPIHL